MELDGGPRVDVDQTLMVHYTGMRENKLDKGENAKMVGGKKTR